MKTLVDIPDADLLVLTELAAATNRSRAALIRDAVAAYVRSHRRPLPGAAFGLWGRDGEDGVTYQRRLRDEW